jgi:hypothetical protein
MENLMTFTTDSEIDRIALGVLDLSLPKADWTHAAHFALALWLLRHRDDVPAILPGIIRAYNEATGGENTDTAGYHETITQASLRAANAFMAGFAPEHPLFDIANRLMASDLGRSDWLLVHWTPGRLFTPQARREWVDPDLKALDS